MACTQVDLFSLLTGSPDSDGWWTYETSTCTGDLTLHLSEDGVNWFDQAVSPGEILEDPGTPGPPYSSTMYWDPDASDTFNFNDPNCYYKFTYHVTSDCGDPATADVYWIPYNLNLYDDQSITLCPVNTNYSLLQLLRDASGHQDIPSSIGDWEWDGNPDDPGPAWTHVPGPNGYLDTYNPSLAMAGDVTTFIYTVMVDPASATNGPPPPLPVEMGWPNYDCTECTKTVKLTITILPGSSAGVGATIMTCV